MKKLQRIPKRGNKIMEKEKNTGQVSITPASIDVDVLNIMKEDDVLKAISDDVQIKRVILNCFCEFLSQIKDLKKDFDDLLQTVTICSTDKLAAFFKELNKNVADEEKRMTLKDKISKSHQKSKKLIKKEKTVVQK